MEHSFGKSPSRYRSNKSERRREKQNREEPSIAYDDKIGYYWMNLNAVESEEENWLSADDIERGLSPSHANNQQFRPHFELNALDN